MSILTADIVDWLPGAGMHRLGQAPSTQGYHHKPTPGPGRNGETTSKGSILTYGKHEAMKVAGTLLDSSKLNVLTLG